MKRGTHSSNMQKIIFASIHFLALTASFWILFGASSHFLSGIFGTPETTAPLLSKIIIISCGLLYFLRHLITLFVILKREVPWGEIIAVAPLIVVILILYSILTLYNKAQFNTTDWVFIGIVIFGSYLNTTSELRRMIWKKDKSNKGKLYTKGLFRYAMHINYLGDSILFTGFALLTGSVWALSVPILITLGFIFHHIPELDRYLRVKYKEQFAEYERKTKKFIPWIY